MFQLSVHIDSEPLATLRQCIEDTLLHVHVSTLPKTFDAESRRSGRMRFLAMWLIQKALEFLSVLSLKNSVQEIETHCSKFLKSLQAIRGPAELVANELWWKWQEDVHKKLEISFLLPYSGTLGK